MQQWGTVTCPGNNNVAWLKCVTFDACLSSGSGSGFLVDAPYWGVQGFEVTQMGATSCFIFYDDRGLAGGIHHVIFANNIANGCQEAGFNSAHASANPIDYIVFAGNIAYNAAQNNGTVCGQGFSIYGPTQSDGNAGTHLLVDGNFAWDNVDNAGCNMGSPTDGEGIELDTWNTTPYCQQTVVENNLFIFNGGRGINTLLSACGTGHALTYIKNNTVYGNNTDANQGGVNNCGEYLQNGWTDTVSLSNNIWETTANTTCNGSNWYDYLFVNSGGATVSGDVGYAPGGSFYNCRTGRGVHNPARAFHRSQRIRGFPIRSIRGRRRAGRMQRAGVHGHAAGGLRAQRGVFI